MSVSGISNSSDYQQVYNRKSKKKTSTPVSFGYGEDSYTSSVAASYIEKQKAQKQQMEREAKKKEQWKQFGLDVLKGVTIGGSLLLIAYLGLAKTKGGKEMMQTRINNNDLSKYTTNFTDDFKKFESTGTINLESCSKKLHDDLALSKTQIDDVISTVCTANKTIKGDVFGDPDVMPMLNRGIIMYGKGGIGKTYAMETIAKACGAYYKSIDASSFMSRYQGDSEIQLRSIFAQAREQAEKTPDEPVIIFLDEGQSIMGSGRTEGANNTNANLRSIMLSAMETEGPEALPHNVKFIVTTNYIDDIDKPYQRDGRLGIPMEIQCPSIENQAKIMKTQFKKQYAKAYDKHKSTIEAYIDQRTTKMKNIFGTNSENEDIQEVQKQQLQLQNEYRGKLEKLALVDENLKKAKIGIKSQDDIVKIQKEYDELNTTCQNLAEQIEISSNLIKTIQNKLGSGKYYNFTPADIKGFVSESFNLLRNDNLTIDSLKELEQKKATSIIDEERKAASRRKEELSKKLGVTP